MDNNNSNDGISKDGKYTGSTQRPLKGILKTSSSFDYTGASSCKSAKFDELNVLQTFHPIDKDYGHMKIEEPKTPFNYIQPDMQRDQLDAALLTEKLRIAANAEQPRCDNNNDDNDYVDDIDNDNDNNDDDDDEMTSDEEESAEEKMRRLDFERRRKQHYKEFEAVKLARKLIQEELSDDDDDDNDHMNDEIKMETELCMEESTLSASINFPNEDNETDKRRMKINEINSDSDLDETPDEKVRCLEFKCQREQQHYKEFESIKMPNQLTENTNINSNDNNNDDIDVVDGIVCDEKQILNQAQSLKKPIENTNLLNTHLRNRTKLNITNLDIEQNDDNNQSQDKTEQILYKNSNNLQ